MKFNRKPLISVAKVKECINPIAFYEHEGQELGSKCRGHWLMAGVCPFHSDRSEGSFFIHKEEGAFHCFSCNAKGRDFIAFTEKKYEISFSEAIKKLQSEWGIS